MDPCIPHCGIQIDSGPEDIAALATPVDSTPAPAAEDAPAARDADRDAKPILLSGNGIMPPSPPAAARLSWQSLIDFQPPPPSPPWPSPPPLSFAQAQPLVLHVSLTLVACAMLGLALWWVRVSLRSRALRALASVGESDGSSAPRVGPGRQTQNTTTTKPSCGVPLLPAPWRFDAGAGPLRMARCEDLRKNELRGADGAAQRPLHWAGVPVPPEEASRHDGSGRSGSAAW